MANFIKKSRLLLLIIFLLAKNIVNIKNTENINLESNKDNNNKLSYNKEDILNDINYDALCSKFQPTCPIKTKDLMNITTNYIIKNKIIEKGTKNFPLSIPKIFYYRGIYEYYGIISEKLSSSSDYPNLESGLLNFIIASYFGSREANYRLYILYESDLISHIIYTKKFLFFLENEVLLKKIMETKFWRNFDFFYKYPPNINNINDEIRRNLQNQIGHNFLYLSILKKYNPAMLVGGVKYALGLGVEKKCDVATQFLKEVSFRNIAGKIMSPEIKGNFAYTRFSLEYYEHINNIYDQNNQVSTLEELLQINNILKDDDNDILKKKEVINQIGIRYFYGIGVEKDLDKAKKWFEIGANYNIGQSFVFLGQIYLHGFGIKKQEIDYNKAHSFFLKAILYGEYAMGYSGIGYMYYYGLGVKKNKREAYNCFLQGIRSIDSTSKDSSWDSSALYFNMISLLIEDEDKNENSEENEAEKTKEKEIHSEPNESNENPADFDHFIKDIMNEYKKILEDISIEIDIKESKDEINNILNDKEFEQMVNNHKTDKKKKIPKDFNLAYKYASYLTLKQKSYGTYILAMMNDYNINSKLFSCEENLNFFRFSSETNDDTFYRIELSRKLYLKKQYQSAFLIILELSYEGHKDSIPNIIALLTKRNIFKNQDYQKYMTHYFIELGLKLELYDLFFLSISANFFYKEKNYKKAIELYTLLINHAGGENNKFYISEGFFNLGMMENFGYGIPRNLTKSKKFLQKAEEYDILSQYPVKIIKLVNKIIGIFGNKEYLYSGNDTVNMHNITNKTIINNFIENINMFSIAVTGFLVFYGWFFFNLKYQDIDNN